MSEHNAPPGWTYCPNCAHPWSEAVRGEESLRCASCGWWWLFKPVDEGAARLEGARIVRDLWMEDVKRIARAKGFNENHAAWGMGLQRIPKDDAQLQKLIEGEG